MVLDEQGWLDLIRGPGPFSFGSDCLRTAVPSFLFSLICHEDHCPRLVHWPRSLTPAAAFDTPKALLEALYSPYQKGPDFDWLNWDESVPLEDAQRALCQGCQRIRGSVDWTSIPTSMVRTMRSAN